MMKFEFNTLANTVITILDIKSKEEKKDESYKLFSDKMYKLTKENEEKRKCERSRAGN